MPKYGAASIATLASEINSGYWDWFHSVDASIDSGARYWENDNPGNPTEITVNMAAVQADQRSLITLALDVWQAVADIHVTYTTGAADITYNDLGSGQAGTTMNTFYDALTNKQFITSATVDVSRDWAGGPAGGVDSYFFQTLVHETGHALGLGHSGNYNGGATNSYYNTDSTLYANDTWQWSVMSYNDQFQYGGFSTADWVTGPEIADIYAIQGTYGASTTSSGDTVYGYGASSLAYDFGFYSGVNAAPAFTIYDSGGTDTLNCSNFNVPQTIDLRAGNWSSIGGNVDNICIYTGVVIEKAIGGSANDGIIGNDANNTLYGGAGDDQIDSGLGVDTLYGGPGNDLFEIRNANDVVVENPGEGTDRYDSYVSINALPANVENIVLYGSTDLYAIANDLGNAISGSLGNNSLYGLGGDDQIYGYTGDDKLDGGPGNDKLVGGPGNDIYEVDSPGDVVVENFNEGIDRLDSYISMTLGANVEDLVLYGTPNLNGTGNGLANAMSGNLGDNVLQGLGGNDTLYGYTGNDVLDGGVGADVMNGGPDNDTYYVDNAGDQVIEAAGGGTDHVLTSVSYTLGAGQSVEIFTPTSFGSTTAINLTGNALVQSITGNAGNNTLNDGGAGAADTLRGLGGNDNYIVNNSGDIVIETTGGGTDHVLSSVSFTLGAGQSVEILGPTSFASTANINLTGNALAQTIIGNAGNNTLNDGGAGAGDTLQGLGGNDNYIVNNTSDIVLEGAGGGTDHVLTSVSFVLGAGQSVESFTPTSFASTTAINLTGNALAQSIIGNAGNNTLNDGGAGGADTLQGLGGNDNYIVNNTGDAVLEAAGGGSDHVLTSVSFTLGAGQEIENFTPTSFASITNINLTGNSGNQSITGNAGNNVIDGKAGNDTLQGLGGNDTFVFDTAPNAATNVDHIADFIHGTDKIELSHAVFTTLAVGNPLAATAFATGAPTNANQHIIYNTATGGLSYDDDGNGAHAAVEFAILNTHPVLANTDIFVV
jgi:Ca2+-binding RTX toxin-like protein